MARRRREWGGARVLPDQAPPGVDLDVAHPLAAPQGVVVLPLQACLADDRAEPRAGVPVGVEVRLGHFGDVAHQVRHGGARGIEPLGLRLNHEPGQHGPVLLQPGHRLEGRVADHDHRLVAGGREAPQDLGDVRGVDRDEARHPRQHRAERVAVGGQELDRVPGNVLRDDLAMAIEDGAARGGERNRPQPVGFGPQLELVVLQDLGAEERAGQHQEGADQHPPGHLGPLPDTVGVEPVHVRRPVGSRTTRGTPAAPAARTAPR